MLFRKHKKYEAIVKKANSKFYYIKIILFFEFLSYSSKDLIFGTHSFTCLNLESIFGPCCDFSSQKSTNIYHAFSCVSYYAQTSSREFLLTDYSKLFFIFIGSLKYCIIYFSTLLTNIFLILYF
jgi:hypothetical protein